MSFFEEIDQIRLLERNSERIFAMEERQARKLIKVYRRARELVRDRLTSVGGGTFTQAQLTQALFQINYTIKELNAVADKEMMLGFETVMDQGLTDMAREVNSFEKNFNGISSSIPIETVIALSERPNFLFNQYKTSMNAYSNGLRQKIERSLAESVLAREPLNRVVGNVLEQMGGDEWRVMRIVRTELHQAYNVSKMNSMGHIRDNYIPDLKKTLYHPIDSRTGDDSKVAAVKNLIVDVDKPFRYKYKDETRTFMAPPDRPNDRSILIPYRESYDNDRS